LIPPQRVGTGLTKETGTDPTTQAWEGALHDITNQNAAARSFLDLVELRVKTGKLTSEELMPLLESARDALEKQGQIVRQVRSGIIESYQPGDVLMCKACGYTFVHRKAAGKMGSCRRCKSYEVTRWKP
jgi:predicted Zn-ribbon and HTH transcriptional regulator